MKIRIATRRSKLALWQARHVAGLIRSGSDRIEVEEVPIETKGDRIVDRPLAEIGGKGLFVAEIERAIVDGRADLAVHSLKDVPGDIPLAEGTEWIAFPRRAVADDVLVTLDGAELFDLEAGSRVGTTSERRVAMISEQRNDLAFGSLRGNVETRLRRLENGDFRAIVLAAAGLERLGLCDPQRQWSLPHTYCLPAVGQGTIAVQGRKGWEGSSLVSPIDHQETRLRTLAERALLRSLGGNCHSRIAGHASVGNGKLRLEAFVGGLQNSIRASREFNLGKNDFIRAKTLGEELARTLEDAGATTLISELSAARAQAQKLN